MQALAVAISDAAPGAEVGITFTEPLTKAGLLVLYQCCSTSPGAVAGFVHKFDDVGSKLEFGQLRSRVDHRARDLVSLKLRDEHTPEAIPKTLPNAHF
jgi:hypothetical protein